jgi:hypothetical protein
MPPSRADVLWFLMVETVLFTFAALVHRGFFFPGYEHERAAIAELVVAVVLGAGLIYSFGSSDSTRRIATSVQVFALLGVIAGVITMAAGIGPRTGMDLILHAIMAVTLFLGVLVARRSKA